MKRLFGAGCLLLFSPVFAQVSSHPPMAVVVAAPPAVSPSPLFARAPVLTTWEENGQRVPIYFLETHIDTLPTRDAFAKKLGTRLWELTAQSGYENCAAICVANHNPHSWAAVVTTTKSQATCLVVDVCPEGYKLSNADIHSHIHASLYKPNRIDRHFLGKQYGPKDLVLTVPNEFSDEDYMRTGYMVSNDAVWFQAGRRQVRKVWTFPH